MADFVFGSCGHCGADCRRDDVAEREHPAARHAHRIPAGDVRLRVAQTGQLDVPDTYLAYQYENVATVLIDGTEVTLSQNPGRNAMASWTRNEFDYLLLCEEPQMNLLGGVIQDFVTQTTASTVSGQRVTQE